ncbi:MAG: hypothetical protein ACRDJ9_06055 [Dehalococcoidia bacterium]
MLGTRLARAHAALGQRAECEQVLNQVRAVFASADQQEEPLWVSYVDSIEVAAQEGACYLDLGMTSEASAALTRAVDLLKARAPRRVRDHVHYLSRLAKCHLLDGEVERGCEIATEGLAINEAIGSARVVERLTEFHDALERFKGVQATLDFRELFATVVAPRRRPATGEGHA